MSGSEFVEKYQELYLKDPKSKVFAPLAEAYRKMGMLKEAMDVCERGVNWHPNFASGRVAYAKVLIQIEEFEKAIQHLEKAVELSPENLLAHTLLADCYIKVRDNKKALHAYKMALFMNPQDTRTAQLVKKLESLTADEYDDELFKMKPLLGVLAKHDFIEDKLQNEKSLPQQGTHHKQRQLERVLSLTDAFIVRNDIESAERTLAKAEELVGAHPEIARRRKLFANRLEPRTAPDVETKNLNDRAVKVEHLEILLQRINERKAWL